MNELFQIQNKKVTKATKHLDDLREETRDVIMQVVFLEEHLRSPKNTRNKAVKSQEV